MHRLSQYNIVVEDDNQPLIVGFKINEERTTAVQVSEGKPKQPGEDPQVTYLVPKLCQETGHIVVFFRCAGDQHLQPAHQGVSRITADSATNFVLFLMVVGCRALISIGSVQVQRNFFNSRNTCVVEKYAIEVCFVNLGQRAIANLILGYCFAGLDGIRDG